MDCRSANKSLVPKDAFDVAILASATFREERFSDFTAWCFLFVAVQLGVRVDSFLKMGGLRGDVGGLARPHEIDFFSRHLK